MFTKTTSLLFLFLFAKVFAFGQQLHPGFDKNEYKELMLISARTTASPDYYKDYPEPSNFRMIYQSKPIGLDNLWDLWTNDKNVAVISLRGTTEKPESWLANFYAAMVPAKGELKLNDKEVFHYQLAQNPKAAVHVGWLLSMAYLSKEIVPKIDSLYKTGTKEFLIMGHSQGGAISFLLTSYLYNLQQISQLPKDIRFKTYCSAAPKPGNLYYSYEYEAMTQAGWAYNVVNAADWVPEMPISIQTLKDFNNVNPFTNAKVLIKKQKFPNNLVLKHVYNKLDKPTKRAQKNYEKYLGNLTSKIIKQNIKGFMPPLYYSSNDYVRTGTTIVLLPNDEYFKQFPDDPTKLFPHHFHAQYLLLLDQLPNISTTNKIADVMYTPSAEETQKAKANIKTITPKRVFIHSMLGIQSPQFSALNIELTNNGFMKLSNIYFSRGGGFYTIFPKLHLATLFNYSTYAANKTEGNHTNALRGTTVGTSLGIVLLNKPKYQLIPFGGIVYSWFGVRLSKNNNLSPNFSNYLSGGPNQQHIATNAYTWNVGLHFATNPFLNKPIGKNITLGLRSGYSIPVDKATKWTTNGKTLTDGPKINAQGFYCNFILGLAI
ncbi:MAG TPA: lipase family protein [Edaphocola sp.]|nr:lipase family protein [Edaphocola sp.]